MQDIIDRLLHSEDPSVRFIAHRDLSRVALDQGETARYRNAIINGDRATGLLSELDTRGELPFHPYKKWYGAHWGANLRLDSF